MTARVQETLIAATIASVDVHTNATISESPIATPLHTEGGPFLGSRLLPDIWTSPASPLVISEARRLTADPVASRRTQSPSQKCVASRRLPSPPQEGVASRWSRSPTQRRVTSRRSPSPTKGRVASRRSPSPAQRRVASRRSPSPTQRLVASRRSPSPTQRRVASKGSPPPKRMGLASVAGPSSSRRPLYRDFRSPRRSSRDFLSPQRGSPSSKRRRYEARDSVSPQQLHSSRASSQEPSQELYRSLLAGSSHHDSRRYLRFVEKELTSSESSASG